VWQTTSHLSHCQALQTGLPLFVQQQGKLDLVLKDGEVLQLLLAEE
jgi:hypothetical protein